MPRPMLQLSGACLAAILIAGSWTAATVAAAEIVSVPGFAAALEQTTTARRPLAVLVHGSAWQGASRRIAEQVWRTDAFRDGLTESFTLTEIAVDQAPDEAAKKTFAEATKGWDAGSVKTFPAVQVYGSDGHLLKTLAGRDLRDIAGSPDKLAAAVNDLGKASRERDRLREAIAAKAGRGDVSSLIDAVCALGLAPEKDAVKKIRDIDPEDRSGWAARLSFTGWDFLRRTSERIGKGEATAALDEVESMLANEHYEPPQRSLLLAAKGMLLAALERTEEAWQAYQLAHAWDPDGVNGKAVIHHAHRTVGATLRVGPQADAATPQAQNLTRDRAKLAVISPDPQHDRPADHASLFSGPLKDFAFHTATIAGPHVVVDLQESCRLDTVQIVNRASHQERAAGLTLWLSADGREWRQAWEDKAAKPEWTVDLRADSGVGPEARYLKIGLPATSTGVLHLRAVNVFGTRPGAPVAVAPSPQSGRLPMNTSVSMQFDPSRIDMRAIAAYAKQLAKTDEQDDALETETAGEGSDDPLTAAARGVIKSMRPIKWRSVTNQTVVGTALVITPETVTIEHDGTRTEVPRKMFSPGSSKAIATIESRVRSFFDAVADREGKSATN